MCLESVKNADAIVFCDGGSIDYTRIKFLSFLPNGMKQEFIINPYNQEDKTMNGKQRNFYLDYLKQNYPNDWALCLDADEIVNDLSKVKEFIQDANPGLYSIKMRHFIGDLGHEDATKQVHYVLNRLFKISEAESYPEVEHPVLQPKQGTNVGATICTTIWHLSYIPNTWEIKKKYENHLKKSNMHTPEYLKNWYYSHLFGEYPKSKINLTDIPKVIFNEFGIDKDEFYFMKRGIELKNVLMVKQWHDYFKPESVLDLGCGRGPYLFFWNWFEYNIEGIELSKYAVNNAFINKIIQGDVCDESLYKKHDLITAIDILEHLDDTQLDKTLNNMSKFGNKFLFSIPFEGDNNLFADPTHKQFHTKEWWINKISSYKIKIDETPSNWLFKEQILIGQKI